MSNIDEIKNLASRIRGDANYTSPDPYVSTHIRPALANIATAIDLIADEQKRLDERLKQLGV